MKFFLFVVRQISPYSLCERYPFGCFLYLKDALKVMEYWKNLNPARFGGGDFRIYESDTSFNASRIRGTAPVEEDDFYTRECLSGRDFDTLWKKDHKHRISVACGETCEFEIGWFFSQSTADTMFKWLQGLKDGNKYAETFKSAGLTRRTEVTASV